jgi:hypothetical protein
VSGRGDWPSRDPIQEEGGLNLYAYVQNNPVDDIDPYGLKIIIDGPSIFQNMVNLDLQKIRNANPALNDMINELDRSVYEHHISPYYDNPNFHKDSGNYTTWRGHNSDTVFDPCNKYNGWRTRDPVDSLAHELRHALSIDRGNVNLDIIHIGNPLWDGVPFDEVPAVFYENLMRRANGEEVRTSYFDPYNN